jgi:uncharacterized membrane protein
MSTLARPAGRYLSPVVAAPIDGRDGVSLGFLAAALGGGLLIGTKQRGAAGWAIRAAGAALLGCAAQPAIVRSIRAAGARRRALTASASVDIERSVPEVFAFFKDFESFPRVLGSLRSVVDYQDGRSHWEMYTPSGNVVAWDVVVTKYVPNCVIAWESVPGSEIEMHGLVRFTAVGLSSSRVSLEMIYRPVRTEFTDALFALIRRQSRHRLSESLERARYYLESLPSTSAITGELEG